MAVSVFNTPTANNYVEIKLLGSCCTCLKDENKIGGVSCLGINYFPADSD